MKILIKILGIIILLIVMLSDLGVLLVIGILFWLDVWWGVAGLILSWFAVQRTGGYFDSWKKENRDRFLKNWNNLYK